MHGRGLFATADLPDGTPLGWMWGRVVQDAATVERAEAHARTMGSDRVVLLRTGGRARRALVVDVRGCVFEWANCADDEWSANLHVSERGAVETACDVRAGDELRWWYADRAWRWA